MKRLRESSSFIVASSFMAANFFASGVCATFAAALVQCELTGMPGKVHGAKRHRQSLYCFCICHRVTYVLVSISSRETMLGFSLIPAECGRSSAAVVVVVAVGVPLLCPSEFVSS